MSLTPFIIDVSEKTLNDLKSRLSNSRLPETINENGWSYGTNLSYMKELLEYWLDEYNWREKENYLNSLIAPIPSTSAVYSGTSKETAT